MAVKKSRTAGIGCMIPFFGVFALMGGVAFWAMGIRPLMKALEARSWVETPAVVTASEVERHAGSKGSTYNIAIAFGYTFEGVERHGKRYDFNSGSSSGEADKQRVVERFPVGAKTTCWVNPKNPAEAVIDRNLGWWFLWGLFPLIFLAVGLIGMIVFLGALKKPSAPVPASQLPVEP